MNREADLETLRETKPFLRGVLAFLLFMRAPAREYVHQFYEVADK